MAVSEIRPEKVRQARRELSDTGHLKDVSGLNAYEVAEIINHPNYPIDLTPITSKVSKAAEHLSHIPTQSIEVMEKKRPFVSKILHNLTNFIFSPFKHPPHTSPA